MFMLSDRCNNHSLNYLIWYGVSCFCYKYIHTRPMEETLSKLQLLDKKIKSLRGIFILIIFVAFYKSVNNKIWTLWTLIVVRFMELNAPDI